VRRPGAFANQQQQHGSRVGVAVADEKENEEYVTTRDCNVIDLPLGSELADEKAPVLGAGTAVSGLRGTSTVM
jgi:hypothetical protein